MTNLSQWWGRIQGYLFSWLEEELGPLTEKQQQLITVLEIVRIEEHVPSYFRFFRGRPPKNRSAIARAFVAKAVYNMSTTRALLDRLESDIVFRRICGWESRHTIPNESTFSRAFHEFARSKLPQQVHHVLINKIYEKKLVGHISRDSTAIIGREKPKKKNAKDSKKNTKRKRGRPKKGEENLKKELTRIKRQKNMTLDEMLTDLPRGCDVGTKKNSKGYKESWIGYKLHIDSADGSIPISCILTSASTHDSQVAIPLATLSAQKVISLYDLMDAAYDIKEIKEYSRFLHHVPIIDANPRRNKELKSELAAEAKRQKLLNWKPPEKIRYNERSTVERVNGRLKDEFGGRSVQVQGHAKVMCHLMFGVLALTVDQLIRLV